MMGDFIYSESKKDVHYNYAYQRGINKFLKRILTFALLIVSGGILWFLLISPFIMPARIDVNSIDGITRADVLKFAGIASGASYFSVNAQRVEQRLSNHYLVESAVVDKIFPGRISINIQPRQAIAMVYARINGVIKPAYFDKKGIIFQIGDETSANIPSYLPVITGIYKEQDNINLGTRFSKMYLSLFNRMSMISDEDSSIWNAISEIEVVNITPGVYDLVLYPVFKSPKIRMSSDINKDNIFYALIMAEAAMNFRDIPEVIDIRSGNGVIYAR